MKINNWKAFWHGFNDGLDIAFMFAMVSFAIGYWFYHIFKMNLDKIAIGFILVVAVKTWMRQSKEDLERKSK